jgi:hypothetical protein
MTALISNVSSCLGRSHILRKSAKTSAEVANLMLVSDRFKSSGAEHPASQMGQRVIFEVKNRLTGAPIFTKRDAGQEVRQHASEVGEEHKGEHEPPYSKVFRNSKHHLAKEYQ